MYQSLAKNFVMHASHNDIFIFHLNHSKAYVGLCNKLGCYFVQHFVIQLALFKSVCVCLTGSLSVCICVCAICSKRKYNPNFMVVHCALAQLFTTCSNLLHVVPHNQQPFLVTLHRLLSLSGHLPSNGSFPFFWFG